MQTQHPVFRNWDRGSRDRWGPTGGVRQDRVSVRPPADSAPPGSPEVFSVPQLKHISCFHSLPPLP